MNEWIEVGDYLPEEVDCYLVLWKPNREIHGFKNPLFYAIVEYVPGLGWSDDIPAAHKFGGCTIEYWRPLPAKPDLE